MPKRTTPKKKPSLPEMREISPEDASFLRQAAAFDAAHPLVDETTGKRLIPRELADVILLAIRFAATLSGAPARCRNKACRDSHCHLRIDAFGDGTCHGEIAETVIDDAALMLAFVARMGQHYLGVGRK